MDDLARESLRRRFERALDAIDRLRPAPAKRAFQPVPVGRLGRRNSLRAVRPVRAWSRLVGI